ncbi:PadR family transcriptional regulator [uncultured Brevundimonas sp.]|uniref:PadR family transcriptional regulator n=1 Tax=uncultured Brevundimonas sp. TaxID=213418 RepID=UPI0025F50E79|nr:PadR family transcriptional regulator [uncultured Brevundimonas sp.]
MLRSRAPSPATRSVLLALVEAAPAWSHGYELCRQTGLKSGTLYPLLIRLEGQGYLVAEWQAAEPGRPPRHAYRLTAEGLRYAAVSQHAARDRAYPPGRPA